MNWVWDLPWTESLCPPKLIRWNLIPGIWRWCLWVVISSWGLLLHEWISALIKDAWEIPHPFLHMKTQWEDSCLWTKKMILIWHESTSFSYLDFPICRTVRDKFVFQPPSLGCFHYSHVNTLKTGAISSWFWSASLSFILLQSQPGDKILFWRVKTSDVVVMKIGELFMTVEDVNFMKAYKAFWVCFVLSCCGF